MAKKMAKAKKASKKPAKKPIKKPGNASVTAAPDCCRPPTA